MNTLMDKKVIKNEFSKERRESRASNERQVTIHLDQQLRLDSATCLVFIRSSSSTADGIYLINEDGGRSIESGLHENILMK